MVGAKISDDVFDAIVAARASFFADTDLSRRQADIIVNHDQLALRIHFVIVHQLPHGLAAQVHICHRLCDNDFLACDHALSEQCLVACTGRRDLIFVDQVIDGVESDVVLRPFVLARWISQTYYNIHKFSCHQTIFRRSFCSRHGQNGYSPSTSLLAHNRIAASPHRKMIYCFSICHKERTRTKEQPFSCSFIR